MDTSLSEAELEALEIECADRSIFTQDVLLNTLMVNKEDEKIEPKHLVRERSSPMPVSPPPPQQQQPSQSAVMQSSSAERPKNGQNEQLTSSKRPQQRTSPSTERTSNQRMATSQSRIDYNMLSRPPHQPSGTISVREVLVGNNYASADTTRRKPICTVDSINQTTEPPTSH